MTSAEIINNLKKQKYRITQTRQKIVDVFVETSYPISALKINSVIKVNKTTIYRELEFLLKRKIIQAADFGDEIKRYELAQTDHHHHLICLHCKKIEDISFDENLKKEEENMAKYKKFKVVKHNLEFFGYCQNCI